MAVGLRAERLTVNSQPRSATASGVLDKPLLQKSVAALHARLGLSPDPTATGEQAQEMSLRDGVRPEDRVGLHEILRVRQEGRE